MKCVFNITCVSFDIGTCEMVRREWSIWINTLFLGCLVQARYVQAKLSVHDRSLKVATVIESLEMEMELLCLTGVEDQLQTDVRPTLEILRNAGIKVTGKRHIHKHTPIIQWNARSSEPWYIKQWNILWDRTCFLLRNYHWCVLNHTRIPCCLACSVSKAFQILHSPPVYSSGMDADRGQTWNGNLYCKECTSRYEDPRYSSIQTGKRNKPVPVKTIVMFLALQFNACSA